MSVASEIALSPIQFKFNFIKSEFVSLNKYGFAFFRINKEDELEKLNIQNRIHIQDLNNIRRIVNSKSRSSNSFCSNVRVLNNDQKWDLFFVKFILQSHEGRIKGVAQIISGEVINSNLFKSKKRLEISDNIQLKTITPREKMVVDLICSGLKNREIAEFLKISIHTVQTHRKKINKKLGIKNSMELYKFNKI